MNIKKDDPESIKKMFDDISKRYDKANNLMSFKCHKIWNRKLVKIVTKDKFPKKYLDLCCGTGDITLELLKKAKKSIEVFLLDFSGEMLICAKNKLANQKHRVHFLQADCQDIPLPSLSIDCITISYGIRNVKEPSIAIEESYRVLGENGVFGILELTRPKNSAMKFLHKLYTKTFLPIFGWFFTKKRNAYKYLCQSIEDFISPQELKKYMEDAGFKEIQIIPLMGGVATIIVGKKL